MKGELFFLLTGPLMGDPFSWLSKKMTISFETSGGMVMGLTFKRSVIENVAVDIQKARQAIEIINKNVINSQSKI